MRVQYFRPFSVLVALYAVVGLAAEPVTPAQFCARYPFESSALSKCRERQSPLGAQFRKVADHLRTNCRQVIERATKSKRASFDAVEASRCLAVRASSKDSRPDHRGDCSGAVKGLVDLGQPCANSVECQPTLSCLEGQCVAPASLGGECEPFNFDPNSVYLGGHAECVSGAHCSMTNLSQNVCVADVSAGAPCAIDQRGPGLRWIDQCGPGLRCFRRACIDDRASPVGGPCAAQIECQEGLFCQGKPSELPTLAPETCASKFKAGAVCDESWQCLGDCVKGRCASVCESG